MKIRILSDSVINQIAAGEVIESPCSVLKELIENALDAGATRIELKIIDGGKGLIYISDNGCGMTKAELEMCLYRHATSKLENDNLSCISTFGFRGEALAAISSISRVSISTKTQDEEHGWKLVSEAGKILDVRPATLNVGTVIEVKDLFFATPVRLKFLKSVRRETEKCIDVIKSCAIAASMVEFKFYEGEKLKFCYSPCSFEKRIFDVLGDEFCNNCVKISMPDYIDHDEEIKIYGYLGVPTYCKSTTAFQYFFVNERFVHDKTISSAIKFSYRDVMMPGKYPACVFFINTPLDYVDVNVHPSKTEIRFRSDKDVRGLISTVVSHSIQFAHSRDVITSYDNFAQDFGILRKDVRESKNNDCFFDIDRNLYSNNKYDTNIIFDKSVNENCFTNVVEDNFEKIGFFGQAIGQLADTYIISTSYDDNHLIVVDQHAAAERMKLEDIINNTSVSSQFLLLPEFINLSESAVELLIEKYDILAKFGFEIKKVSDNCIVVNAVFDGINTDNLQQIIEDIVCEFNEFGNSYSVNEQIIKLWKKISCHGSIRAGKKMNIQEMNCILRRMENYPNIAQCSHGRPTYIVIKKEKLESLFERA